MNLRPIFASCIAMFIALTAMAPGAWASCLAEVTESEHDWEAAVAMISSRDSNDNLRAGTAFLIDADHGVFLTACHVVNMTSNLVGYFQSNPDEVFNLSVVDCADNDVALVEIDEDDRWQLIHREPLRLSFHLPEPQEVSILSTGHTRPIVISRQSVSFDVHVEPERTEILISVAVANGDSGAPVISDSDGLVIAMVTDRAGTNIARAVPITELQLLLSKFGAVPIHVGTERVVTAIQDSLSSLPGEDGIYWVTGEPIENSTVQFGLHRSGSVAANDYGSLLRWSVPIRINNGRVDWSIGSVIRIRRHEDFGGEIVLNGLTDLELDEDFAVESNTQLRCDYSNSPDAGILEIDVDVDAVVIEALGSEIPLIVGEIDQAIEDVLNSEDIVRGRQRMWEQTRGVLRLPFVRFVP